MSARTQAQIQTTPRDANAGVTATTGCNPVSQPQSIPVGLCQCGCGGKTNLATRTRTRDGHVKGQHVRYAPGHNRRKSDAYLEEDRGHKTPCWIWQLCTRANGYGQVRQDGRMQQAHRVYYERYVSPIPEDLLIDHLCRVRNCVNPAHLEPVTHIENVRRGAAVKLSHEQVREVRASSASAAELALHFSVSKNVIWNVRAGNTWKAA